MTIDRLHNTFLTRCGQSGAYQDFNNLEIDEKLNEAQRFLIEKYHQFPDSQIKKDLYAPFTVLNEEVEIKQQDNYYYFELSELTHEYVHLDRITFNCGTKDIGVVKIVDFDNLSYMLNDAYQKPSNLWKQAIGNISGNRVNLYFETAPDNVLVSYIRKPKEVFFGGYDTVDYIGCQRVNEENCDKYYNKSSDPVTSEFSNHYQDLLIDIAVWLTVGQTKNSIIFQLINTKVQTLDQTLLS